MASKKATKRRPAKRKSATKAKRKAAKRPAARKIRPGFISHTELASANPDATVAWAKAALGWKFGKPQPSPGGSYHMWSFNDSMGGGVRSIGPGEKPGAIPYCEVTAIKPAYETALKAGATSMMPPTPIPGGMGWIAVVVAPGGVPIGYWAQK
jgi:predicted enzyme related to lactoylglutathione lyase